MSKELKVKALLENVAAVTEFVDVELEAEGCPMKAQMQIDVVIDELVSNVANYAYSDGVGELTVRVDFQDDPKEFIMTLIDSGVPYNPLEKEDPDISASVEDRPIGGLGIFMVKKMMDDMQYEYLDGKNILTVRKYLTRK